MNQIVVFAGPTLSEADVRRHAPEATVLSPAAHGDVLRAALTRPSAIGIIDGVFDRVPAIWHKEVLWALSNGVAVYGAASMGALRARELSVFGMRGVGRIYEAYASDELEDDDEVAVLHADADDDFRCLSDAMVDIRITIERAREAGVVSAQDADQIIAVAKARHYTDRRLRDLTRAHDGLHAWVREHHRSQKSLDAIEMIQRIVRDLTEAQTEVRPTWALQHTQYWDAAYRKVLTESGAASGHSVQAVSDLDDVGHLLDESRLDPSGYRRVEERALLTLLASSEAQRSGVERSQRLLDTATAEALHAEGVSSHDQLTAWLEDRQMAEADLHWIRRRWLELRFARRNFEIALPSAVIRELTLTGELSGLRERAEHKRVALSLESDSGDAPESGALVDWYFRDVISETLPSNLDVWSKQHGWRDLPDLLRALGREWAFQQSMAGSEVGLRPPIAADRPADSEESRATPTKH